MKRISLVFWLAFAELTAFGCAHDPAPKHVRYADIDKGAMQGFTGAEPVIIEFQPGERLPVNLELTGEGFELQPQHPPLDLVVKQHCFVRVSTKGLRMSLDPDRFDIKPRQPGSIRVGLSVVPGQPAKVDVIIAAPHR